MKRFLILIAAGALFTCAFGQQILRTNLEDIAIQSFAPGQPLDGFTVTGPDDLGYVYLVAHAGSQSGEIIRTRWQGTGFQAVSFSSEQYLTGFDAKGPDAEGYVYLLALGSGGSKSDILRSCLPGLAVQSFTTTQAITSLTTFGPDAEGYVYLVAGTAQDQELTQISNEAPEFALARVASPCSDAARISYSLAQPCMVSIRIFDASGRLVADLVEEDLSVGSYDTAWNVRDQAGRRVNAGVYFVRMDAGSFTASRKLVAVR